MLSFGVWVVNGAILATAVSAEVEEGVRSGAWVEVVVEVLVEVSW